MRVTLKKENEREIVFRFDHMWGWVALAAGPGLLLLWPKLEADARLFVAGFAALMAVFGVATVLRRYHLRFDLASGTWHRRQGFWPNVIADSGPVSDARKVAVSFHLGSKREGGATVGCDLRLVLEGEAWTEPLKYARTNNLPAALVLAERVANRLGIPIEKPGPN